MARVCTRILIVFGLLHSTIAIGSVLLPNDGPYYRWHHGHTMYIFDKEGREAVAQLATYHRVFRRMYDRSYGWKLDERQDLILASSRHQITNAYATILPNLKSVWFPAGAPFLEESASSSWLLTLDAHETAHLYQINAKSPFPTALSRVFGNTPMAVFFIWPIFIHPNVFTPSFLIEGNAVLNESRINLGGRLHSGGARALVLAQIKENQIDPARLINDQFRFPYGSVAYLQGGYFQAHLAEKYGIEKTNGFFVKQGEHYLWPLILNRTFRDHFGESYPQEIREYVRSWEPLAQTQKSTEGRLLLTAKMVSPLNHDQNRIWFLASDGVEPPILYVYDKQSGHLSETQTNLPMGKVFFEGDVPLAVASVKHNLRNIEYSLYGENFRFDPRFRGQILTDRRAGKTTALAATNSWLETRVLLDGEPYDVAHSSVILDDHGNVYYFRQNGTERVLYKNREPVFKFEGYYAKPMEVTPDGTIYFVANTEAGASLYRYNNYEIFRVLPSDRVMNARQINEREFLIVEVGAATNRVFVAESEVLSARPAVYNYGFTTETIAPEETVPQEQVENEDREYNSFRELRFSAMDFSTGYSSYSGMAVSLLSHFYDPLEYQRISLGYGGTQFRDQSASVYYEFTKYLVKWQASYLYHEDFWRQRNHVERRAYDQSAAFGFTVPLLRWRTWDAGLGVAAIYEKRDTHDDPSAPSQTTWNTEETYGARTQFFIQHQINPPLGLFAWRKFSFGFTNRLQSKINEWTKKHNTSSAQLFYQHGFPREFYLTTTGQVAWAETRDIHLEALVTPSARDITVPLLTGHREYLVKTASAVRLEAHKVVPAHAYSARFPVGIDRIAPVIVAQATFLDESDRHPPNIFEWGYGADLQLLLFHKMPAVIRYLNAYNTRDPKKEKESLVRLTLQTSF